MVDSGVAEAALLEHVLVANPWSQLNFSVQVCKIHPEWGELVLPLPSV
jgi:hypothetical protein